LFVPANFLVIKIMSAYNMRVTLVIGCILQLIAAWTRVSIYYTDNFALSATFGNVIGAFAQVFFGNCTSKLASMWFGDKERALSTALGTLAMPIGCIAGFVVPASIIGESDVADVEAGKAKFVKYLIIQSCVVTLSTVPFAILARNKPPSPPSISQSVHQEPEDLKAEMGKLLRNKNYLLLCVAFTCLNSICTCMGAVVSSVTAPYDYTAVDNAIIGGVFIISGVIGTVIISVMLDRHHKFKLSLIGIAILATLSLVAAQFALPSKSVAAFSINTVFIGLSSIPAAPIGNALAVEITYPVPESMSNGMMNIPNILYGFSMGILSGYLCEV
jgi:FLVCR family feline leukemia virus subgroup C receptor-related protein